MMRRLFSLPTLSILSALWLLILWPLQNFVGEKNGWTALLLYLPAHIWGFLPVLLLLFSLQNRKLALLNGGAVAFWLFFIHGFQLPRLQKPSGPTVRVMSYNALGKYANARQIAEEIRGQNAQIVCLQESADGFGERVAAQLGGWNCKSRGDVSTLSKFPIARAKTHHLRGTRWIMDVTFQTPNGPLRVVNAHLSTSYQGQPLPVRGKIARVRQLIQTSRPAAMVRLEQLPNLLKATRGSEPMVLCGDFNSPPRGIFYRRMKREFSDSFAQSGLGVGATYPANFPLLRIDYLWLKNGVSSARSFVPKTRGSDHLPLVCDLSW